jgi:hypothetical protein
MRSTPGHPQPPKPPAILEALVNVVSAAPIRTSKKKQAEGIFDCAVALLSCLCWYLDKVPDHWSLRQLLLHFLRQAPCKDYQKETIDDLCMLLKRDDFQVWYEPEEYEKKSRKSKALNSSCDTVASVLSTVVYRLERGRRAAVQELASSTSEPPAEEPAETVGPRVDANYFCWRKGRKIIKYRFGNLQWRLLYLLWPDDPIEGGKLEHLPIVPTETLWEELYGKLPAINNRLWQLQANTNDTLARHNLPFVIQRPRPLALSLDHIS